MKYLGLIGIELLCVVAAFAGPMHPEKQSRVFLRSHHSEYSSNPINVLHYDVNLFIDPERRELSGTARLELIQTDRKASEFSLDLLQLKVDSVYMNGKTVSFEQTSEKLVLSFDNDHLYLSIFYHGQPGNDGAGGFFFKDSVFYTFGEGLNSNPPSMFRYWVPSHDVPDDKATLTMTVTVPRDFDLLSNGELVSLIENDSTRTFKWKEDDPIATYLIALAAADYDTLFQSYISVNGDTIPLSFYVFPDYYEAAKTDWKNIKSMMKIYENCFGPYPFEQYRMVQVPHRGAMEHQTMTTYSSSLITGDLSYEYVIAHELAHQWWGDWVTLSDWREIWLNEGFASYSEVLFLEQFYGETAKREHLQRQFNRYKRETLRRGHFPIYNPEFMWGATVYDKGSWVLHRLRWYTGDERFFDILQTYGSRNAFGNSSIIDFKAITEEIYGNSLDPFFHLWIESSGYPNLHIAWDVKKRKQNFDIEIEVNRQHFDQFPHPFPLEVDWHFPSRTRRDTLFISNESDIFIRHFSAQPLKLVIDPDQVMLIEYDIISEPLPFGFEHEITALSPVYPSPATVGELIKISYHVSNQIEPQNITISVMNSLGKHVKTLIDRPHLSKVYELSWDGKDKYDKPVPSGLYILRMHTDNRTLTRKFILLSP